MDSAPSPRKVDVVIIGAGLAGLTAADQILQAGFTCHVFEARDRVGGRTWTVPLTSGGVVDLGASWMNDTNQTGMAALAKRFDAELVSQNVTGKVVLEDEQGEISDFMYGQMPPFAESVKQHLADIRDMIEADCHSMSFHSPLDERSTRLDSLTVEEYLRSIGASEDAILTATVWTRAMLGREPADVSALFFLRYLKAGGGLIQMRSDGRGGGQFLRIRQGGQMFALNLAKTMPDNITCNHTVSNVEQILPGLTRVDGVNCRKVICTVPAPTTKKINFTPPLPEEKAFLLNSFSYGYYQKVMVIFKTPFWVDMGFCGLAQSFKGPLAVMRDTSVHADGNYILTCFLAGSTGRAWSKGTETEREEAILNQLEGMFGEVVRSQFIQAIGHQWNDEEWSGYGCPTSSIRPGVLTKAGHTLRQNIGDVHFAGTETSTVWQGLMEGAVQSGLREAARIIEMLKSSPSEA